MNTPPISIIIATCGRPKLLDRTLTSLAGCRLPASLHRIIVIENGGTTLTAFLLPKFQARLPLEYLHSPIACKSAALNEALARCDRDFIIFFDDDVRLEPDILVAYAAAAAGRTGGLFLGGQCLVDYEVEPPAWLSPYLPLSAKGWSKGEAHCPLTAPEALGFNWAAFAQDIKAVGGFDESQGPGRQPPVGEETQLQERLLQRGVEGQYVPAAIAWHYVPRERCTPEWALQRARQMGQYAGLKLARLPRERRLQLQATCLLRLMYFRLLLLPMRSVERRFYFEQRSSWGRGLREGLQMLPH